MFESHGMKLLIGNVVIALIAAIGYALHVTDGTPVVMKYLFYPLYAYVLLSFIPTAIGSMWSVLEQQRGKAFARIAMWGHGVYLVSWLVAMAWIWLAHHPGAQ